MKTLLRSIAMVFGFAQAQAAPQIYYHVHPTTFSINGRTVSEDKISKARFTIASLTKGQFIEYYRKSKNIICL